MACRSCSAGLGRLPKRIAVPFRQNYPNSNSLASPLLCAATTTTTIIMTSSFPSALRYGARSSNIPSRASRRALHTTPPRQKVDLKQMLMGRVAQSLATGKSSYYIFNATEKLYKACAAQADYAIDPAARKAGKLQTTADGEEIGVSKGGRWHDDLALLPTFSTWAHVTMLHMYLLVVRFRCLEPAAQQAWQAQLVDHFFVQAEVKMEDVHDLTSRMIRQRYLKDLFVQWRGLILAYDEGIIKGDAVLASAVWRNLFKAREDVDVRALAAVVAWMRAGLMELGDMPDEVMELQAASAFPALRDMFKVVDLPTTSLKAPFEQAGIQP
ncbi:hypothetical protein N657DRAFT_656252 [Parathielavia appendiculata]|uniref:Ubiquinol-cytochrome c chaperone domain-containing protein n=1 Tax=Parathielavia appendiculata TaxID=2587402 RepID=A0AAN6Z4L5_9PEZI|nr:hypothetical protein N657DRAFT_656252 [Parathielavia appendiculata]